jgi:large subunit ribosomal protein L15
MQAHTLRKNNKTKTKLRRGRGGKRGTFSGRGIKGQKARAGHKIRPQVRDLIVKMPKRKGHAHSSRPRNEVSVSTFQIKRVFKSNDAVNPKSLLQHNLIKRVHGKLPQVVKIIGPKEVISGFKITGCELTGKK